MSKAITNIIVETEMLGEAEHESVRVSAIELLDRIDNCAACEGGWNIQEVIWPARNLFKGAPKLVLLPLDRIGAEPGLSGAHVMIGYFSDPSPDPSNKIFPSRPMVVKVAKEIKEAKDDILIDEKKSADDIRSYVAYSKHRFAIPLHINEAAGGLHTVLWSPFSSSTWIWESYQKADEPRLSLAVNDLAKLLAPKKPSYSSRSTRPSTQTFDCVSIIENVFRQLMPLHRRNGSATRQDRSVLEEYKWYLRNYSDKDSWGEDWLGFWKGDEVEELGYKGPNPFSVLKRLEDVKLPLYCGAVHGDLHPHNIVISDTGSPHIIDFGWTQDNAHIGKDFALLECNLRFVWLDTALSMQAIDTLTSWISFTEPAPKTGEKDCDSKIELIKKLRELAQTHFPPDTDWDREYVVPLFLIAFGLLSHIASFRNQVAARLSVLKLAQYVDERVLPKRSGGALKASTGVKEAAESNG